MNPGDRDVAMFWLSYRFGFTVREACRVLDSFPWLVPWLLGPR